METTQKKRYLHVGSRQLQVLRWLSKNGKGYSRQIAREVGMRYPTFGRSFYALRDYGFIRTYLTESPTGFSVPYLRMWEITPLGEKWVYQHEGIELRGQETIKEEIEGRLNLDATHTAANF